jgi:Cu(I)/Ag(I) efflux system membrane fusion protein
MTKLITALVLLVGAVGIAAGSYRLGAGQWPGLPAGIMTSVPSGAAASEAQDRQVLYWRDPDGKPVFSANPAKTEDGRSFAAVYDDQEPLLPGDKPRDVKTTKGASKKVLYYRNPMGLPDTSPVPKKDWMGMDYIPVYEGEEEDGSTVRVSLDRVQRSGVRTEPAELRSIVRPIRAPGIAKPDERTLRTVTMRADGFIEALYADETGKHVQAGEPLFRIYSPQIVSAQVDYRTAPNNPGAIQRLKNFEVPETILNQLRANPNPIMSIDWPSPVTGVVMQKNVIVGQMVKAGHEMFRLTDLSRIWVIADVAVQDIGLVKIGAPAKVTFRAFPDQPFEGRVTFILHELEMATRTGKVRIEVENPDHRIKHEMFADVEINAGAGDAERLAVPVSAVIDSGNRQVVIVERGEGLFEPRPVKLGMRGDGLVEVRDGLNAGEMIVTTANFLIDAESNLKAALKGFTQDGAKAAEVKQ